MTTMTNLPSGLVILLYTTKEGENREWWFRPLGPFGGEERTAAINPPVTLCAVPAVRAAEAAEAFAARGFTNITIVEFYDPCGGEHTPNRHGRACRDCGADLEETK